MENSTLKFINRFEVSLQDIPQTELPVVFGVLDTLDFEIGETRSVFWYATRLREFLEGGVTGDVSLDALNRACLTFLDADTIKTMLGVAISARTQVLELQKRSLPVSPKTTETTVYEDILLEIIHFSETEIADLKPGIAHALIGQSPEFAEQLKALSIFFNHLRIVCFVLGLDLSLDRYDSEKCFGIIGGAVPVFDEAVLALSLKELLDVHDGIEFTQWLLPTNVLHFDLDQNLPWYEALLRTMILHIVWNVYSLLSEFDQGDLLRRLYGMAAWSGVPVEKILADFVYDTNNVGAYAAAHQVLRENLEQNTEMIPGVGDVPATALRTLCLDWFASVSETDILPDSALDFITKKYPTLFPNQADNLANALLVYGKVCEALLTESNRAGDIRSEERQVKAALAQLLLWFVDDATWPKIVEYFKQESAVVLPKQFFRFLAENFPLENDEIALEKIMKFTETITTAGLLPVEFAPIMFSEEAGGFIWDTEALFA